MNAVSCDRIRAANTNLAGYLLNYLSGGEHLKRHSPPSNALIGIVRGVKTHTHSWIYLIPPPSYTPIHTHTHNTTHTHTRTHTRLLWEIPTHQSGDYPYRAASARVIDCLPWLILISLEHFRQVFLCPSYSPFLSLSLSLADCPPRPGNRVLKSF